VVRVSKAEFAELRKRSERRAEKRKDNAAFIRKVAGKKKLPSIRSLQNRLWDLNTAIVKRRDGPICVACQSAEGYAQNHIIPQCEAPGMAYDLDNMFWGCRGCNCWESNQRASWQKIHFPRIFGQARMDVLWARKVTAVQLRRPDYLRMIAEREAMLANFFSTAPSQNGQTNVA
jgi:hypothetical protein